MKLKWICIIISLNLPFLCFPQNRQKESELKIDNYLIRAKAYYDRGRYDSSVFYYGKIDQEDTVGLSGEVVVNFRIRLIDASIKKGDFLRAANVLAKTMLQWQEMKPTDSLNFFLLSYLDGEIKYKTGKYDASQAIFKECRDKLNQAANRDDSLKVLVLKALGNIELKSGNASNALDYYREAMGIENYRTARPGSVLGSLVLNIAMTYDRLKMYDSADYYFNQSITLIPKYSKDQSLIAGSLANYSNYLIKSGKTKQALDYIIRADSLYKAKYGDDYYKLAFLYLNYAKIYMLNNDYRQALNYFVKSENIYHHYLSADDIKFESLDANVALLYKYMSEYEKSIEKYNSEVLKQSANPVTQILRLRNIGECYLRLGKNEEAGKHFNEALSHSLTAFGKENIQTATCYLSYSDYYSTIGDQKNAEKCLLFALRFFIRFYGPNNREVTNVYNRYCINLLKTKAFGKAARQAQQALVSITPGFSDTSVFVNPDFERLPNDYHAIAALALKTNALAQLMLQFPEESQYAEKALETALLGIRLFETFKITLEGENSQLVNTEKINFLFQYGILAAGQIYAETHDSHYLELAFQLSEKNKATILTSGMNQWADGMKTDVPDSLIRQEQSIKQDLRTFSSLIHEETKTPLQDSTRIIWLQNKMFDKRSELAGLLNFLMKKYPKYYELKNAPHVASIKEIQSRLLPKEMLVEYALADTYLFLFAIKPDTVFSRQITLSPHFRKNIESYLSLLRQPPEFDSDPRELIHEYSDASYKIYQDLIQPIDPYLENNELIIIPDDVLGYLPFETLIGSPWDSTLFSSFRSLPYFLKSHAVSYHYSASLWMNGLTVATSRRGGKALVMAPIYKPDKRHGDPSLFNHLAYLKFSRSEAEWVHKTMGGRIFIDSLASEKNFKTFAPDYSILHLAMHTLLDDENPMSSKLIFSRPINSREDGFLNTYEIYNLKLKAEMVVLSACETGSGELRKGEGIMSMARGFLFAGVPSLLITHWKVNDEPSAQIMEGFYNKLENGKRKALQQSKLEYLAQSDQIFSHPYYWSAYVVIGDDSPIEKVNYLLYLIIILVTTLILAVIIRFKKPIQKNK